MVPLTLVDAIELARKNYPLLKEARARAEGAQLEVGLAHTAYVPRLDVLWQLNRATHNNVFGLLLPQGIVPPVSGPALGTTTYDSVWGSAAGALFSWQAVDFGARGASVQVARADASLATAQTAMTELDVMAAAADAFLNVLAADEGVRATRANVDRLRTFAESVRTLVTNQLRAEPTSRGRGRAGESRGPEGRQDGGAGPSPRHHGGCRGAGPDA